MLTLPSSVRIYVAADPVDLRRGFDGLAAATRSVIRGDPLICVRNEYVTADRDCAVCAQVLRQNGSRSAPHNL